MSLGSEKDSPTGEFHEKGGATEQQHVEVIAPAEEEEFKFTLGMASAMLVRILSTLHYFHY
jgi:hypothetical protein